MKSSVILSFLTILTTSLSLASPIRDDPDCDDHDSDLQAQVLVKNPDDDPDCNDVNVDVLTQIPERPPPASCFPGIGFNMPSQPPASLDNWWCDPNSEYAFLGFSYAVHSCQSKAQLTREFKDIRQRFDGRYVRIYSACDRKGFYDDVVDAAWEANVGLHALIWFGFDGGNIWKSRRDALFRVLHSNPRAKFVVRAVQFGSEPLFDWAIEPRNLATQVRKAKAELAYLRIPVTVSEMAYGYQLHAKNGAMDVLNAVDLIDVHTLPFFSQRASTGREAWPIVQSDLDWFINRAGGKKIILSQNGWPSTTYPGVQPNSKKAVSNVDNERDYFNLLNEHCAYFKQAPGGGIGWFAHIYSDYQAPGYGIYGTDGNLKFAFNPMTDC